MHVEADTCARRSSNVGVSVECTSDMMRVRDVVDEELGSELITRRTNMNKSSRISYTVDNPNVFKYVQ